MIVHRLRPADRFELLVRVLEREGYRRFLDEDGTGVDFEAPDGTRRRVTRLTREAYVARNPFASLASEVPEHIRVEISSGASGPFDSKDYPAAYLDEDLVDTVLGKNGLLRSSLRSAPHLLEGLTEEPSLVLDELRLRGFRGFESARIRFSRKHSTVVIGNNGSGKTSILDAVAMLLSWVAKRIENPKSSGRRPAKDDIQNLAAEAGLTFEGTYYGSRVHWTVVERQAGTRVSSNSELTWLGLIASTQQSELSEYKGEQPPSPAPPVNLPTLVYYPVNRSVLDVPKRVRRRHAFAPLETYDGALTTGDRDFRLFFEWFRERENIENEVIRDGGRTTATGSSKRSEEPCSNSPDWRISEFGGVLIRGWSCRKGTPSSPSTSCPMERNASWLWSATWRDDWRWPTRILRNR